VNNELSLIAYMRVQNAVVCYEGTYFASVGFFFNTVPFSRTHQILSYENSSYVLKHTEKNSYLFQAHEKTLVPFKRTKKTNLSFNAIHV